MLEQQLGITLSIIRPQLARQWNKCVKHCLSLQLTYLTLDSGLTYTYLSHKIRQ